MSDFDPSTGRRTATDKRMHMRLTVGFFSDDNKLRDVVDPIERAAAITLLGECIAQARRTGSDGHVSLEQACAATGLPMELGKLLIADGAVHQGDHGCLRCPQPRTDLVYVHDYLEHNRSAAQEERTLLKRRAGGNAASAARWDGHQPAVKQKRPVGRPRKNPVPVASEPVTHPAELRAREETGKKRPGRPRKSEPRVFAPEVHELCDLLAARVRQNGFTVAKELSVNTWLNPCRLLLERGVPHSDTPLTVEQVRKAILWATDDNFWSKNIRSMDTLRDKYERLREDAQDPTRLKRGRAGAVRRSGSGAPPAAVNVSGMAAKLAKQMGSMPARMVKGG